MTTNEQDQGFWKKVFGATGLKIALVLIAVFWLMIVAASWAESAETPEKMSDQVSGKTADRAPADTSTIQDENSEYNFNWLDPEKKIYVLQNRRYTKEGHVFLNLLAGPGLSNSYRTVWNVDPRIDYYFSEHFGIEAFYTLSFNTINNTYTALQQVSPTTLPYVREIQNELGVMAQWVPWYAKINVFNNIIYFDWYFQAGLGQLGTQLANQATAQSNLSYTSQNEFALYAGTGHLYHLSEDWQVRVDFTGMYYRAPLQGNVGSNTWFSNYNFEIGLGYRL
jgi:outer membrane beta-barrel protein